MSFPVCQTRGTWKTVGREGGRLENSWLFISLHLLVGDGQRSTPGCCQSQGSGKFPNLMDLYYLCDSYKPIHTMNATIELSGL